MMKRNVFILFTLTAVHISILAAYTLYIEASGTEPFGGFEYNNKSLQNPLKHSDPDGPYIHQPTSTVYFKINENGTEDIGLGIVIDEAEEAAETWNEVTLATIDLTYGGTTNHTLHNNDNENVVYWDYHPFGVARTWITYNRDTEEISDVDIMMNEEDIEWRKDEADYDEDIHDLQSILTHEFGHLLGIGHSDTLAGHSASSFPTMASGSAWALFQKSAYNALQPQSLAQDDIDAINYLYGTLRVPEVFATLEKALDFAQSGNDIIVSSHAGTQYINGTYTIPSGTTVTLATNVQIVVNNNGSLTINNADVNNAYIKVNNGGTLTVNSGATFNMASDDKFYILGKIQANGGTWQKSGSATWKYIYLLNSGANNSFIKNAVIDGALYGIYITNASGVVIDNVTVKNSYYYNLYVYSCAPTIKRSTFNSANIDGAKINSASGTVKFLLGNTFKSNDGDGVEITGGSSVEFGDDYENADVTIRYNGTNGIKVSNYSYVYMGIVSGGYPVFGGNNYINDPPNDVNLSGSCALIADRTWWGESPPNSSHFENDGTGYFDFTPWLTSAPPGLGKVVAESSDNPQVYMPGVDEIPATAQFVNYIRELELEDRGQALGALRATQKSEIDPQVAHLAKLLYVQTLIMDGQVAEGVALGEQLLSEGGLSDDDSRYVALQLFHTYLNDLDNPKRALSLLQLLYELGEEDAINGFLAEIYKEATGQAPAMLQKPGLVEEEAGISELALESYPNPFNPSATIRFGLPEEGYVTLKVYDVLGREAATLVEGYIEAGPGQIVWNGKTADGSEVPTGIYIARLVTPDGTKATKLVMMK
ncbi:MAG: T9SS type A sorting domain-containing protein [Fidelibacterota bacterium]|nr:MAG: T9SS type A sorting domain-containing protein [Candidatus Neomarinimicrobiota bacterium]